MLREPASKKNQLEGQMDLITRNEEGTEYIDRGLGSLHTYCLLKTLHA